MYHVRNNAGEVVVSWDGEKATTSREGTPLALPTPQFARKVADRLNVGLTYQNHASRRFFAAARFGDVACGTKIRLEATFGHKMAVLPDESARAFYVANGSPDFDGWNFRQSSPLTEVDGTFWRFQDETIVEIRFD